MMTAGHLAIPGRQGVRRRWTGLEIIITSLDEIEALRDAHKAAITPAAEYKAAYLQALHRQVYQDSKEGNKLINPGWTPEESETDARKTADANRRYIEAVLSWEMDKQTMRDLLRWSKSDRIRTWGAREEREIKEYAAIYAEISKKVATVSPAAWGDDLWDKGLDLLNSCDRAWCEKERKEYVEIRKKVETVSCPSAWADALWRQGLDQIDDAINGPERRYWDGEDPPTQRLRFSHLAAAVLGHLLEEHIKKLESKQNGPIAPATQASIAATGTRPQPRLPTPPQTSLAEVLGLKRSESPSDLLYALKRAQKTAQGIGQKAALQLQLTPPSPSSPEGGKRVLNLIKTEVLTKTRTRTR